MSQSEHFRMHLNNFLQDSQQAHILTYEQSHSGPPHARTWTVVAYIRNIEYGRGTGSSAGVAKEEAARQTLAALQAERGG